MSEMEREELETRVKAMTEEEWEVVLNAIPFSVFCYVFSTRAMALETGIKAVREFLITSLFGDKVDS